MSLLSETLKLVEKQQAYIAPDHSSYNASRDPSTTQLTRFSNPSYQLPPNKSSSDSKNTYELRSKSNNTHE